MSRSRRSSAESKQSILTKVHSIAGTHTTSASAGLLFWNLLHSPESLSKCVAEIDSNLPALGDGQGAYPIMIAESSTPFLKQCIKENFRITPVFTMPLARRVMDPAGVVIGGYQFPQGVSLPLPCISWIHQLTSAFTDILGSLQPRFPSQSRRMGL